jgi:hypothetical protein
MVMSLHGFAMPTGGFPDGLRVTVTGGRYAGASGAVVNHQPDLRPGSVWVALTTAGTHLVPGYRLTPNDQDRRETR